MRGKASDRKAGLRSGEDGAGGMASAGIRPTEHQGGIFSQALSFADYRARWGYPPGVRLAVPPPDPTLASPLSMGPPTAGR